MTPFINLKMLFFIYLKAAISGLVLPINESHSSSPSALAKVSTIHSQIAAFVVIDKSSATHRYLRRQSDQSIAHRCAHSSPCQNQTSYRTHAKTYDLLETHVDETMFIYWIAAIFIQMILDGKATRPAATREEIAFGILDTWDCFIVLWMGNIFRASVCKAKEHGITMVTGTLDPKG
ncbi:hypothetical protein V2G26_018190 [Clonostachys chloroleuca]